MRRAEWVLWLLIVGAMVADEACDARRTAQMLDAAEEAQALAERATDIMTRANEELQKCAALLPPGVTR